MEKKIEVKCEFEGYQPTLHPRSTVKEFAAHPNHPSASDSRGVSVLGGSAIVSQVTDNEISEFHRAGNRTPAWPVMLERHSQLAARTFRPHCHSSVTSEIFTPRYFFDMKNGHRLIDPAGLE
jgi:hypothetical protein